MARGVGLRVRRAGAPQPQARGRGAARLARAKDGSHAARGIVVARGLKENLASLPAHEDVTLVTVKETGHTIKPGPGKMASVRICKFPRPRFQGGGAEKNRSQKPFLTKRSLPFYSALAPVNRQTPSWKSSSEASWIPPRRSGRLECTMISWRKPRRCQDRTRTSTSCLA